MNVKKLVALAALLSLALPALPTMAATVNGNPVTVKWNTQAVATLTLHSDYTAAGAFGAAAGAIVQGQNGGAGLCTATDPTNTDLTLDFGAVTPDTGAAYTNCNYKNAINAQVVTSSTNWNLTATVTTGTVPADTTLCALPNGGAFPFSAATLAVTQTVRAAALTLTNTCTGGVKFTGAAATLATETHAFGSSTPANIGHDLDLILAPLAASTGAYQSVVVTYTLTAN